MSADPKREVIQEITTDTIEILIIRDWDLEGIAELYRSGGWWKERWETSGIARIINGSFAFAVAIERSTMKTVGMGRVISDGGFGSASRLPEERYRQENSGCPDNLLHCPRCQVDCSDRRTGNPGILSCIWIRADGRIYSDEIPKCWR
jgi:hypothetical protein